MATHTKGRRRAWTIRDGLLNTTGFNPEEIRQRQAKAAKLTRKHGLPDWPLEEEVGLDGIQRQITGPPVPVVWHPDMAPLVRGYRTPAQTEHYRLLGLLPKRTLRQSISLHWRAMVEGIRVPVPRLGPAPHKEKRQ